MTASNPETVLITGASAGIGYEFAHVFAEHGHDLVLVARSEDKLEALADQLRNDYEVTVTVIAADLTQLLGPQSVFDAVQAQGLTVGILVNNAGQILHGRFAEVPLADHLRLIRLNIVALTTLTHLFLAPMLARGQGRILNVASIGAFVPLPRISIYAASKSFVLSFSEALAVELADSGVSVTALCPGLTDTAMLADWSAATDHQVDFPELLVMPPAAVARAGYDACLRGDTVYVSGLANRLLAPCMQLVPRWLTRNIAGYFTRWVK